MAAAVISRPLARIEFVCVASGSTMVARMIIEEDLMPRSVPFSYGEHHFAPLDILFEGGASIPLPRQQYCGTKCDVQATFGQTVDAQPQPCRPTMLMPCPVFEPMTQKSSQYFSVIFLLSGISYYFSINSYFVAQRGEKHLLFGTQI